MARHEKTVRISANLDKIIWMYLRAQRDDSRQGRDETVGTTAVFDDGRQMDIKCCAANDGPSWTEAVLFDADGTEIRCAEPSDEFTGEWELEYDGDVYVAHVVAETRNPTYDYARVATLHVGGGNLVVCEYTDPHVDGTNIVRMIQEAATAHFAANPEEFAKLGRRANVRRAVEAIKDDDTSQFGFRIIGAQKCDADVDPDESIVDPYDVPESEE